MIARNIHYSGRVQGVGFRATTRDLAADFPVAGFVRNLENGDVEVVVEGAVEDVDRFQLALEQQMARFVRSKSVSDEPVRSLVGFEIRY